MQCKNKLSLKNRLIAIFGIHLLFWKLNLINGVVSETIIFDKVASNSLCGLNSPSLNLEAFAFLLS
jgi:hypothetical protein